MLHSHWPKSSSGKARMSFFLRRTSCYRANAPIKRPTIRMLRRPNTRGRRPAPKSVCGGLPGTCIVRLTKVFGRGVPLLRGWCESFLKGQTIRPFADMPMAPVPLDFAVRRSSQLPPHGPTGIVQISAAEDITYAAAARFVAKRLGAAEELVQPVTVAESGVPIEYVPRHTTLDTSRLQTEFGLKPPCPRDAIELGMKQIGQCKND